MYGGEKNPSQDGYPHVQGGYPQVQGGYPHVQGGYPPPPEYQPPQGGYQPPQGGYQPPQGGYQPPQGGYPQPQGWSPPAGGSTVVYHQQRPNVIMAPHNLPPEQFVGQIVFSCIASWCCFCPLGFIAFILAMVAQANAHSDRTSAHRLGIASYILSGLAVLVTVVAVIVCVAIYYSEGSQV